MNTWLGVDWGAVSALATLVGTLVIAIASVLAVRQLKEMKKAREAQGLQSIWSMLNTQEARKARRALIEGGADGMSMLLEDRTKEEELLRSESVCATWDCVAVLGRQGLLDPALVAKHWQHSLISCWNAALPMINKYRKERETDVWAHFEWLVLLAKGADRGK